MAGILTESDIAEWESYLSRGTSAILVGQFAADLLHSLRAARTVLRIASLHYCRENHTAGSFDTCMVAICRERRTALGEPA